MMPRIRTVTLVLLAATFFSIAADARAEELKIGLVLVQNHRDDRDPRVVNAVSDAFLRSRRFTVIERHNLDAVFQEKGLQSFIGGSEAADIGNEIGLDWIGLLSYSVEPSRNSSGNLQESYLLSVRLLEVSSAKVLHTIDSSRETSRVADHLRASGEHLLDDELEDADLDTWSTPDSIEAAADRLLENLRQAFPPYGYVIQKDGERKVVVDLGTEVGVREGDTLEVFTYGEPIIHPVTGRELPGREITQAVLKVLSAQAGVSTCKVRKTEGSFAVGARVRFKGDEGLLDRVMGKLPFNQ